MRNNEGQRERVFKPVRPQRLLEIARALVAIPSRAGEAGPVLDCLAELLKGEGFAVERPDGG